MLGPADAGRHTDRRKPQYLALHHLDSSRMGRAIMREAAGEIARLEEIIGEGFQHVVEGILAMGPAFEEMPDIEAAVFARGPDEVRGPSPSG